MLSRTTRQELVYLRGQNKVRTIWEEEDLEIPIYEIPAQERVRAR